MHPIIGSLEALLELINRGHEVNICTSPLLRNPFCVQEKYDWVKRHLSKYWTEKVIVSKDKTIIHGDLLIDDKPEIHGARKPDWEHILFSQPYNLQVNSKRRLTWKDWQQVIPS